MRKYSLAQAFLCRTAAAAPAGSHAAKPDASAEWVHDAVVSVSDAGIIAHIEAPATGTADATERVSGIVVPGMPNAHSHAFQRAMAGSAEFRHSAKDSFWSWRQTMYALANRLEPDELQLIATQLYIEMLKAGYTAVAEFHYLNRARDGSTYTAQNALWDAIDAAAADAGIGLTLLPTLYQTADFGARPLRREQLRFAMETAEFLRAVDARVGAERRRTAASHHAGWLRRTGAAFHSLRAVPLQALGEAALGLRAVDAEMPVHIHVAEQLREVQACKRETGQRPIELLLQTGLLNRHWCLVHATHATAAELQGIADSNAAVCVAIGTEGNLGDGRFDAVRFLSGGGRLCVGSDSQCTVSPAEELRWLEYQQRLRRKRRAVLATGTEPHAGTRLWRAAASTGAQALGQPIGAIAVGLRADWLVLDPEHPTLAGAKPASALDHLIFARGEAAVRDVMVAGRWVIRERSHFAEERVGERFSALMRRLSAGAAATE
jgi:formimidoylglutamate deiminase